MRDTARCGIIPVMLRPLDILAYAKHSFASLTISELLLWIGSMAILTCSYIASGAGSTLSLISTLLGATCLIFMAKGNAIGHIFGIGFIITYAIVAWGFCYWGEVLTYLGMSLPSTLFALISWVRHPVKTGEGGPRESSSHVAEVQISHLSPAKFAALLAISAVVTVVFYFLLGALDTPNLVVSTISVTTSMLGAGMMFMRSPYYALGYMANDLVLILLWILACMEDISYLPVVTNFAVFLANDFYGFLNWQRMKRRQLSSD